MKRVQLYRGGTVQRDTLEQFKRQFGSSAVILNTRTLTSAGLLGVGRKPFVEITAAGGMSDLPAPLWRGTLQNGSG